MRKDWLRRCDFLNMPASLSYKNEIQLKLNKYPFLNMIQFIYIIDIYYLILLLFE